MTQNKLRLKKHIEETSYNFKLQKYYIKKEIILNSNYTKVYMLN